MNLTIQQLTARDYITGIWSGGTTTELFLYPETGSYSTRQFQFRLSSATVNLEESDFTPLPGIHRFITPLKGSFTLTHPDRPAVHLEPLEVYGFPGGIPTHCVGTATDFNLMLQGCSGSMETFQEWGTLEEGFNFYFPLTETHFTLDGQGYRLQAGQLLVVRVAGPVPEGTRIHTIGGPVIRCHVELPSEQSRP